MSSTCLLSVPTLRPVQSRKFLKVWNFNSIWNFPNISLGTEQRWIDRTHDSACALGVWIIDEGEECSHLLWSCFSGLWVWLSLIPFYIFTTILKDWHDLNFLHRVTQFVGEADTILADSITGKKKSPHFSMLRVDC